MFGEVIDVLDDAACIDGALAKTINSIKEKDKYLTKKLEDFDYDLQDNYVTFHDENRAENALNHFYIKELMNKENIRLRSYCMSKNTVKLK